MKSIHTDHFGAGIILRTWLGADDVRHWLASFPGFGRVVVTPRQVRGWCLCRFSMN